ncbi:cytochrome P450 [Mycena vulgaris]|nr:cytochrome P450 [Mycena vulgaris]
MGDLADIYHPQCYPAIQNVDAIGHVRTGKGGIMFFTKILYTKLSMTLGWDAAAFPPGVIEEFWGHFVGRDQSPFSLTRRPMAILQTSELAHVLHNLQSHQASMEKRALRFLQTSIPLLNALLPVSAGKQVKEARRRMFDIGYQLPVDSKAALKADEGKKTSTGRDLLSILVKVNISTDIPHHQKLSDAEFVAQIATMFFSGDETTREELLTIYSDTPTIEDLSTLPYLDSIIKETLRIHAPIPTSIRRAMHGDVLPLSKPYLDTKGKLHDTLPIRKGTYIRIPIQEIQLDPAIWGDDVAEFKYTIKDVPGIWSNMSAFGAGVHHYVGFRFSIFEMKVLLFTLLRAFEFEKAVPEGGIVATTVFIQKPKGMVPATRNEQSARALAADRALIADTEAQILNLHCLINALCIQKDQAQERLDSYKYPVLTLPNEIVSEIFIDFLPVYPLCPPRTGLLSPTLLTHICRKWREIALTTPALWRAISLYCTGPNIGQAQVQTLEVWLARSGICPLSIQMENYYYDLPSVEIFEVIVPYRARWEYLKIHVLPSNLDFVKGPMPLVRQLNILVEENNFTEAVTFCQAPRLRSVILEDPELAVVLPWSQLTSLTLLDTTSPESAEILAQTTSLVYCELVLCGPHVSEVDIRLPSLESLVLVKMDPDPWDELPGSSYLDAFVVPTLRKLQIPEKFLGTDPSASLASLIS